MAKKGYQYNFTVFANDQAATQIYYTIQILPRNKYYR